LPNSKRIGSTSPAVRASSGRTPNHRDNAPRHLPLHESFGPALHSLLSAVFVPGHPLHWRPRLGLPLSSNLLRVLLASGRTPRLPTRLLAWTPPYQPLPSLGWPG
jgi:hypothetical protein